MRAVSEATDRYLFWVGLRKRAERSLRSGGPQEAAAMPNISRLA